MAHHGCLGSLMTAVSCFVAAQAHGADEVAPAPREAEVLTVKPREVKNPGVNPSSVTTGSIRPDGTYDEPFGKRVNPSPKLRPLLKALDPARQKLLEEFIFEEEWRAWEWEYLRRHGFKGPETLDIKPREVTPK